MEGQKIYIDCPKCGGRLEALDCEWDDYFCWKEMTCVECEFSYNEVYEFSQNESNINGNPLDKQGKPIRDPYLSSDSIPLER